jgi:sugar lactone lactonase YvrE
MKRTASFAANLLVAMLAACGGPDRPATTTVDPSSLCVTSSCGTKTVLLAIPNAENTLFTPEGRLFVSGSSNVYEITQTTAGAAGFSATPIYDGSCNFTGMAQRGEVLYVACEDLNLYATRLDAGPPALKAIHALSGMASPNGVTLGPSGEMYITDGPISSSSLPNPQIVRLQFDPNDPMTVTQQISWLTQGVGFPNGLNHSGDILYFTDSMALPPALTSINAVEILPDGSPGPVQSFATFDTGVPDDLSIVGGDVLVALYSEGAVALLGSDGSVLSQTDPLSFSLPSSVKPGQPPMFQPTDLIVTEKGVVDVPQTGELLGNDLAVFRRNTP